MRLLKYICIICVIFVFVSCEENERQLYDTEYNALNFIMPGMEHNKTDSLYVNFMFYPDEKLIDTVKVQLQLLGMPLSRERHYQVMPVDSGTTAEVGVQYELKDQYVFPGDTTRGIFEVYIKRDESLRDSTYRLMLEFVESDDFKLGLGEYQSFIVNITDNLDIPPPFWEMNQLNYTAGPYHPLKCKKYIEIAGVDSPDWLPEIHAARNEYLKTTRRWFEENPTYDEDGNRLYFEYR